MTDYDMFKKQFKCEYDEEVDYFIITWEDKNSELIYKENDGTEEKIEIGRADIIIVLKIICFGLKILKNITIGKLVIVYI